MHLESNGPIKGEISELFIVKLAQLGIGQDVAIVVVRGQFHVVALGKVLDLGRHDATRSQVQLQPKMKKLCNEIGFWMHMCIRKCTGIVDIFFLISSP